MLNVFKFKLDLKRQQSILINRTVNGDTAVQFQITVTDGGTPVTLDADLNKVLAIFRRSDNQVYVQDAETGLSFSGSVVTINVRPASFRAGRNSVELQIYTRPNSQATSWPDLVTTEQGLFNVRANTLTGDGPNAPSQLPMLEQLIHDAGVAVDNCNTATTAADTAAGSANAAATSANNAATAANSAAANANDKATAANNAATAANNAASNANDKASLANSAATAANNAAVSANAAAAAASAAAAAANELYVIQVIPSVWDDTGWTATYDNPAEAYSAYTSGKRIAVEYVDQDDECSFTVYERYRDTAATEVVCESLFDEHGSGTRVLVVFNGSTSCTLTAIPQQYDPFPSHTSQSTFGKYLKVKDDGIGLKWDTPSGGGGGNVPTPASSDRGKYLSVDSSDNMVWSDIPAELPNVGSNDKDKYLHTNASTGALEWVSAPGGGSNDIVIVEIDTANATSSMTFDEIQAAATAGKTLLATLDGNALVPLTYNSALQTYNSGWSVAYSSSIIVQYATIRKSGSSTVVTITTH